MDCSGKIIISMVMMPCLWFLPFISTQANVVKPSIAIVNQSDVQQLSQLWMSYQDHILVMEKALDRLKNQVDESQKNAIISQYIKKIDQTKTAVNRLILTQANANLLRRQMIEHATKYQNAYRLATTSKPSSHQLNMAQRLTLQTNTLFQKMKLTAQTLSS